MFLFINIEKEIYKRNSQRNLLGQGLYYEKGAFDTHHVQNARQPRQLHHNSISGNLTATYLLHQKL